MDGTQKILRTIMNGQSSMKSELLGKMTKLEKKVDDGFEKVNERFNDAIKRIDKIGLQVAKLEDDAPTVEEFDNLVKKVEKVQQSLTSNFS